MKPLHALVVHPPLSIARDFIDYPYASDLGAVQLAAVLRGDAGTALLDTYSSERLSAFRENADSAVFFTVPLEVAMKTK